MMRRFASIAAAIWLAGSPILPAFAADDDWQPRYPSMPIFQDYDGSFELQDHRGNLVSRETLKGRLSLIYFGYTSCPDICATALYTVAVALEELGAQADAVTPYFVNLDHDRKSLPALTEYLGFFHEGLVGLTGTQEQIRVIAGAFSVRYKTVPDGSEDTKTVHSGMMFLLDHNAEVVAMLPHDVPADWLTATLREHLSQTATQ